MDIPQSLVLGVTQGLTEFLPVSSTAHLILAPQVFPINAPRDVIAHTYDTIIQIGTVVPVLIYFRADWMRMLQAAGRIVQKRQVSDDLDERLVKYLLLGSIPAGVIGLLLEDKIELLAQPDKFRGAYLAIGLALIFVGLLMGWAEAIGRKMRDLEHLRTPDAWFVGFAQACALFPGVSRSGSTITAGLLVGLTREAAARFSFLLMTPIMLAATGYKTLKLLKGANPLQPGELESMILAAVIAGITGYMAIAFLLRWLRTRTLSFFIGYRLLVGAFCIGMYFMQK